MNRSNNRTILQIKHLNYQIGKNSLLKNLNLKINPGESTVIIGKNGSGKTTLFRIVMGLLSDYQGRVNVEKSIIFNYLPESTGRSLNLKVEDYLGMYARLYGISNRNYCRNFLRLFRILDLEKELRKKMSRLSKGYRQRVAICRTFLNDPQFVIMDEPMADIDPEKRAELISGFTESGDTVTFLVSSHYPEEIEGLCTRIYKLSDGQLEDLDVG